jgi:cytochrome d ubiquinol oxidase subunit II
VVLKTTGDLQERSRAFGQKAWWAVVALTAVITFFSFRLQPNIAHEFSVRPWGYAFPLLALLGLIGMRTYSARRSDLDAFLCSGGYLAGMLTSAAFGVFPYVLPSNAAPEAGLTVTSAAAANYGLWIGLAWWIPGMLLATAYSVFVYRHFAGKVDS